MVKSEAKVSYNRGEMYNEMKHQFFQKTSFALSIVTTLLLVMTVYVGVEESIFYESGSQAEGRIVGYTIQFKQGRRLEFPVIQYTDQVGIPHMTTSNLARKYSEGHKIGDKFKIIYQESNPNDIRESSLIGLFGKLLMVSSMTYLNFILFLIFHYYLMITPLRVNSHGPKTHSTPTRIWR